MMKFSWIWLLLSACAGARVVSGGRTVMVNWTVEGVSPYSDLQSALEVDLGDTLLLTCNDTSNLFIQDEQVQYDSCNGSAGSGRIKFVGHCGQTFNTIQLMLTANAMPLENTINFVDNHAFYLTSYYSGVPSEVSMGTITSGGECESGLKMVLIIGELDEGGGSTTTPVLPSTGGISGSEGTTATTTHLVTYVTICITVLLLIVA